MTGGDLWRGAFVLAVALLIPGLADAGPTGPRVPVAARALLVADAQKGAALFQKRCSTCHTVEEGPNKIGPHLHGLFGRQAATLPGHNYSADLRASRIVWNAQTLGKYLADPHRDMSGGKMPYPGLSSKANRDDIISYLEQATR